MEEMKAIFTELQTRSDVKAAVLISGKPGCFIAGADIKMLERCDFEQIKATLNLLIRNLNFNLV